MFETINNYPFIKIFKHILWSCVAIAPTRMRGTGRAGRVGATLSASASAVCARVTLPQSPLATPLSLAVMDAWYPGPVIKDLLYEWVLDRWWIDV